MTEQGQCTAHKLTVRRRYLLSAKSIAKDPQTSCGHQISTTTACRELHGMGFHGQVAASKPHFTKCTAKHQMQWCKAWCDKTL
ncbi:unnamed protein product, partial [Staurois parvus]